MAVAACLTAAGTACRPATTLGRMTQREKTVSAMITLAIAEIQYFLAFQLADLTGGENGIQIVSSGTLFGLSLEDDKVYYYLVLVVAVLSVAFAVRVVSSGRMRGRPSGKAVLWP